MMSTCICNGMQKRVLFSKNFDALICSDCKSQHFVSPLDKTDAPIFEYDGSSGKYADTTYLYGKTLRWSHYELLKLDWHNRKVLEIGCFNGFFLDELRSRGAKVCGFDVNTEALSVGRKLFALDNCLYESLSELQKLGPFDDVICIDVLEHLDDPVNFINEITNNISSAGRLIIAGPTIERIFHDKSDYPPHHKWWFSRDGLIKCLNNNGYKTNIFSVEKNGLLLLRNFIGKCISGLCKREFSGGGGAQHYKIRFKISGKLIDLTKNISSYFCKIIGISYCSTILIGIKG